MEAPRRVVAAFDVDGTLTPRDTLLPFLLRAFGRARVARAFAATAPTGLRHALGRASIDELKCRLLAHLFRDVPVDAVRDAAAEHARAVVATLRSAALARLRWHQAQGHAVALVSATLDLYLDGVGAALGVDHVLCTRLATETGPGGERFTGALRGADCTGPEKLRRLLAAVGPRAAIELHAYGDAAGDAALLAAADSPHFRPFRRGVPA